MIQLIQIINSFKIIEKITDILYYTFNVKLFLVTSTVVLIYIYIKKSVYSYWKNHQIPHDNPMMILGTVEKELILQKISVGQSSQNSYNKYKKYPFFGLYMFFFPILTINDPDLIKEILIKKFNYFTERGIYCNEKIDPLSNHLIAMPGEKWKVLKSKFTHLFTTSQLKNVFPQIKEIVNDAVNVCNDNIIESDIFEIRDLMSRIVIDIIFSLSFGFNSKTIREPRNTFSYHAQSILEARPLHSTLAFLAPVILEFFRIPFFNPKISRFFSKLFHDMIEKRKLENEKRNDFLTILLELIENGLTIKKDCNDAAEDNTSLKYATKKLTVKEASAQAMLFFIAGFETSASTLSLTLYELAVNSYVQENLYKEIDEFEKSTQTFNFENLMNLPYLDMVLSEGLRKHSIVPYLNRICVKDYKVPNSNYCIPKGMRLLIPVSAIHHNPEYYPEPDKFDPTRFTKENKSKRHSCTYLPFGSGPRYCMGNRLGQLQIKIILFLFLSNYQFSVCDKTVIPLKYSVESFLQKPSNVYLRLKKRN